MKESFGESPDVDKLLWIFTFLTEASFPVERNNYYHF